LAKLIAHITAKGVKMSEVSSGASAPAEASVGSEGAVEQQAGGQQPTKPDAGTKPVEQPSDGTGVKKYKVKVNGEDMEVTEDELIQGFQTRKAADAKFREAAMARKQAEEFISLLKKDPIKVLSHPSLGIEFRKLAEEYLYNQLEEEMMDPKDRELKKYKAIMEEQERARDERAKAEQEAQIEQLKAEYSQNYVKDITEALQNTGLPKNEFTVKKIAFYMAEALKRGYSLTAKQVAPLVKEDYIKEQKALYSSLDGDMLVQLLGDDLVGKIRKYDVNKVKAKTPPSTPKEQPVSQAPKAKKTSKKSYEEYMKEVYSKLDE
jgi:hypothetical protein